MWCIPSRKRLPEDVQETKSRHFVSVQCVSKHAVPHPGSCFFFIKPGWVKCRMLCIPIHSGSASKLFACIHQSAILTAAAVAERYSLYIYIYFLYAVSSIRYKLACAHSEDSKQYAHTHSLIGVLVFRLKKLGSFAFRRAPI